ncbi:F-box/LRR-repeat protein-like protein [Salvia divinorum]|uniref:F-box/LRR-repeat protein-like protein n=1 Tax=Salvia divinorum TaxID=28513 RepID=A0ABD1FK75_SALDI
MARVQRRRLEDDYTDDRISMLPDEILVLILSSLSLKEAMATSLLSSRWKNLWMLTSSKLDLRIDFLETFKRMGNCERHTLQCNYVGWVDRLLTRLQVVKPSTNLVEFRLSFNLSSSFASWIDDWLSYAVSRKVERLDLFFVANYFEEKRYSFPYKEGNFPDNLSLLKRLSLHYVDVSGEAVAFMLGNCRLLEKLSLHQAGRVSSLEVVGTSPVFKCLGISDCMRLVSVVVRGSELVCIKYRAVGNVGCRFVLVDVPLLTQLSIQSEPCLLDFMLDMFGSVLPQLHTLEIYSTSIVSHGLNFVTKMMPNLKQFVVVRLGSDCCGKCSLMPWFSVVSSPCLQRFVFEASHREVSKIRCNCSTFQLPFLTDVGGVGDHDGVFLSRGRDRIHNSYSQLKEVEFIGYRGMSNQFQMIKQFLKYGTALDKIILDPRSFEHRLHMPWDRIYRNHTGDEILARNRARDQFENSRINVTIL